VIHLIALFLIHVYAADISFPGDSRVYSFGPGGLTITSRDPMHGRWQGTTKYFEGIVVNGPMPGTPRSSLIRAFSGQDEILVLTASGKVFRVPTREYSTNRTDLKVDPVLLTDLPEQAVNFSSGESYAQLQRRSDGSYMAGTANLGTFHQAFTAATVVDGSSTRHLLSTDGELIRENLITGQRQTLGKFKLPYLRGDRTDYSAIAVRGDQVILGGLKENSFHYGKITDKQPIRIPLTEGPAWSLGIIVKVGFLDERTGYAVDFNGHLYRVDLSTHKVTEFKFKNSGAVLAVTQFDSILSIVFHAGLVDFDLATNQVVRQVHGVLFKDPNKKIATHVTIKGQTYEVDEDLDIIKDVVRLNSGRSLLVVNPRSIHIDGADTTFRKLFLLDYQTLEPVFAIQQTKSLVVSKVYSDGDRIYFVVNKAGDVHVRALASDAIPALASLKAMPLSAEWNCGEDNRCSQGYLALNGEASQDRRIILKFDQDSVAALSPDIMEIVRTQFASNSTQALIASLKTRESAGTTIWTSQLPIGVRQIDTSSMSQPTPSFAQQFNVLADEPLNLYEIPNSPELLIGTFSNGALHLLRETKSGGEFVIRPSGFDSLTLKGKVGIAIQGGRILITDRGGTRTRVFDLSQLMAPQDGACVKALSR